MPQLSRRSAVVQAGAILVAGSLAGCSDQSGNGGAEVEMTDGSTFEPATVTVSEGETVTWVNVGDANHTVTAYEDDIPDGATYFASGGFDSEQAARDDMSGGMIGADESYEHTFETAGTYEYFCIPHENGGMLGTVEVE